MIFHSLTFKPSQGTLRMLMNDKIMFDRYYFINSTKHCENKENICALYYVTSVITFYASTLCMIQAVVKFS